MPARSNKTTRLEADQCSVCHDAVTVGDDAFWEWPTGLVWHDRHGVLVSPTNAEWGSKEASLRLRAPGNRTRFRVGRMRSRNTSTTHHIDSRLALIEQCNPIRAPIHANRKSNI